MLYYDCCIYNTELLDLIHHGQQQSAYVAEALHQHEQYNEHIVDEQSHLIATNHHLWTQHHHGMTVNELQAKTLHRIQKDLYFIKTLNKSLTDYSASDEGPLTWSLKTNKMEIVLDGAQKLVADKTAFRAILHGHFPEPFKDSPAFPVLLADTKTPYGNSQVTFLSAALIEMQLTLLGPNPQIKDVLHPKEGYYR